MKTVYLAGPDVFYTDAIDRGKQKKRLCDQYGFAGLYPCDNEITQTLSRPDDVIYRGNMKMIRCADFGIFNLTPFRGVSADVGTVFELGCFVGMKKPIFAYTEDNRSYYERCGSTAYDSNNMIIENFLHNSDNLMLDCSIRDFNSSFFCDSFEMCLKDAFEYYQKENRS